jgi:hypothetical protein
VAILAGLGLWGCKSERKLSLEDAEGRHFSAVCPPEAACTLTQTKGPGGQPVSLLARGRLIAVCPSSDAGAEPASGECRALMCADDDACPPSEGLDHGTCVNGLCVEPAHELIADDSVMLCLAGTGLGRSTPEQVERFALGLNCGSPCRVARICRQP